MYFVSAKFSSLFGVAQTLLSAALLAIIMSVNSHADNNLPDLGGAGDSKGRQSEGSKQGESERTHEVSEEVEFRKPR